MSAAQWSPDRTRRIARQEAAPVGTRRLLLRTVASAVAAASLNLRAQDDKSPITILVGAASSMDFTARLIAEHLRETLGRPVVVSSKLGAGGRLALGELKRAMPDGRTLMFSTSSLFAIYPNIYTKLDYDPVADFTPIAGICWFDLGVATNPMTPAADMRQFLGWAKAQNDGLIYACAPGAGSSSHFVGIAMMQATGIKLTPANYPNSGGGILDLAAGRLPMMITGTTPLLEMHKAGKIRLLAVSGESRSPLAPEIPTLRESGIPVVLQNSAGLYAPARTPREIVDRIYSAVMPMLSRTESREKMLAQSMVPAAMTGVQLAASLVEERKKFENLVAASGYVKETL